MPRKLVYVKWLDHCSASGGSAWKYVEDVEKLVPCIVKSVGWVIKETKDYLIIAGGVADNDSCLSGDICILKKEIVKRINISLPLKER